MPDIDFSDKSKWEDCYVTTDGLPVKILEAPGEVFPGICIVGRSHPKQGYVCWLNSDGIARNIRDFSESHKVIPRPKRIEGWLNIYPNGCSLHLSKPDADLLQQKGRKACIYIDVEEGEGLDD